MGLFGKASDILGMNARNLHYISRYNSHTDKKFADDKIFTKQFLESRHIGVAKLYHVIKNHLQLTNDFFNSLPQSFVVKPNRGFAGAGILVIKTKKDNRWITVSGKKVSKEELYIHCSEILDGKYAISGTSDKVIFEERLEPHPDFGKITELGLPDVRMIVFNKVPIMGMLRVPNEESDGKANMELGAYGMGIDIGTGKTTGAAYYSEFKHRFPNGTPTVGFQIPYWDDILYSASKIQAVSNIGYLGVDMVITKAGVKVLELNARAGLKIQIANRSPQKPRLKKVADLKVITPEEGVDIARTLFSEKSKTEEKFEKRPVIGVEEDIILNAENPVHLKAKIDLNATTNKICTEYFDPANPLLDITIEGKRLKLPVESGCEVIKDGAEIILAGKFLGEFYVDPKKQTVKAPGKITAHVDEQKIQNIDRKIVEIDEQIKLLSYINPQNIAEQKELFLGNDQFSPRFFYKELDLDVNALKRDLKKIPVVDHPLYPIFLGKIEETMQKLNLIETVGTSEFGHFSEKVFGKVSKATFDRAHEFLEKNKNTPPDESPLVDAKTAAQTVEKFLKTYRLSHWKVKLITESVSEMQVTKKGSILIKSSATFSKNRLEALLVHEIGTHVFRNENGKQQDFRIFQRGTAGYLQTEEGIAVYNQNQLGLDLGEKYISSALMVCAIYKAKTLGFRELYNWLRETYNISEKMAWSRCLKAKRGFIDTSQPGAFTKDAIYFKGQEDLQKFLKKGGDLTELYMGKISIKDLKILREYQGIKPAKFLLKD